MKKKQLLALGMAAALAMTVMPSDAVFAQATEKVEVVGGDVTDGDLSTDGALSEDTNETDVVEVENQSQDISENTDNESETKAIGETKTEITGDLETQTTDETKTETGLSDENDEASADVSNMSRAAGLEVNETSFPDEVFRSYVLNKFDKDKDGILTDEEIAAVTSISVSDNTGLKDLTGISYFTNINSLHCYNTGITTLDISKNTNLLTVSCYNTGLKTLTLSNQPKLERLYCDDTSIGSLDVTGCPALKELTCKNTGIAGLNVSQCTKLLKLECSNTGISSLDVSQCMKLMNLKVENAKLSTLNVEANNDLQYLYCSGNPLYALTVGNKTKKLRINSMPENTVIDIKTPEETFDITTKLPGIDPGKVTIESGGTLSGHALSGYKTGTPVVYTYNYGDAVYEKYEKLKVTLNITVKEDGIDVNEINFPDDAFRAYVSKNFDKDGSGVLSPSEIANIKRIKFSSNANASERKIKDMQGIEFFTELVELDCKNSSVAKLDTSKNSKLITLNCENTKITELDVSKNNALTSLTCAKTAITALDISNNTNLINLSCNDTAITTLDLSNQIKLGKLICSNTKIEKLDLSNSPSLNRLECDNANISSLVLPSGSKLARLQCQGNAGLKELDLSGQSNLQYLYVSDTALESLNVSDLPKLYDLKCNNTNISSLDLSNNPELQYIELANNKLSTLDISKTKAWKLDCTGNPLYMLNTTGRTILTLKIPENTVIDLNVPSPTFDLTEKLPGIDPEKVTIVSGAKLEGNMLSEYKEGTPVVYEYAYGDAKTATPEKLIVTLNLTITSVPIVTLNHVPTITAEDKTLTVGDAFDPLADVTAKDDEDGNIVLTADNVSVNTVDTTAAGIYEVTYKVTDRQGASVQKTIKVTVKEKTVTPIEPDKPVNEAPVITAGDKVLTVGDKFDPLAGVTAADKEDGTIILTSENVLVNKVDTTKAGVYEVVYVVKDSQGIETQKHIKVTVKEKADSGNNTKPGTKPNTPANNNQNNKPANKPTNTPKTGDAAQPGLWTLMFSVSGLALAFLTGKKRKERAEEK